MTVASKPCEITGLREPNELSNFGRGVNAVETQIGITVSVRVLRVIIINALWLQRSLGEIPQILSITQFEQMPMGQALKNEYVQNGIPLVS